MRLGHVVLPVQEGRGGERDRSCDHHVTGQDHQDTRRLLYQMDHRQSNQQAPDAARQQRARHGEEGRAGEEQAETHQRPASLMNLRIANH